MKYIWSDRRTFLAFVSLMILFTLGYSKSMEVVMAISTIAVGVAGINAVEKMKNGTAGQTDHGGNTTEPGQPGQ